MLIHCSPPWIEAAVPSLSHDLTMSSLNVISSLFLASLDSAVARGYQGFPSLALATPHPDFLAISFQALPFPKPHCLVGYPQNSPGFSLSCQHSIQWQPPPPSVLVRRGGCWLSQRPHSTGEAVASCQRIPRNVGIGVEPGGCCKSTAI